MNLTSSVPVPELPTVPLERFFREPLALFATCSLEIVLGVLRWRIRRSPGLKPAAGLGHP